MALTKVVKHLSSTPSIVDGGNATAITIDSSENVTVSSDLRINDSKNLYFGNDLAKFILVIKISFSNPNFNHLFR